MRHSPSKIHAPADLAPFIDHTLLRSDATLAMIENLCDEALRFGFFAVCVNGAHVRSAHKILNGVPSTRGTKVQIAAVVGFPLGTMSTSAKAFEARQAADDGATEIDMVMRVDLAKTAKWNELRDDVAAVVKAVEGRAIVKVILETGLLTLGEIVSSARACDEGGAHFVKTCTGFSTAGGTAGVATVEHVALMRESVRESVQVKASGGVRTFETACAMIEAGATRLGTSSGVALVQGAAVTSGY
ncbi:deoxyribose-phosphate aldolase [soil metagenome]